MTCPRTVSLKAATSTAVGMTAQCQRTKNWSFGVKTPRSNTSNGVSSNGGRLRCRIIRPFCGKAVVMLRRSGSPGRASSTKASGQAGGLSGKAATILAACRKRRRLTLLAA